MAAIWKQSNQKKVHPDFQSPYDSTTRAITYSCNLALLEQLYPKYFKNLWCRPNFCPKNFCADHVEKKQFLVKKEPFHVHQSEVEKTA